MQAQEQPQEKLQKKNVEHATVAWQLKKIQKMKTLNKWLPLQDRNKICSFLERFMACEKMHPLRQSRTPRSMIGARRCFEAFPKAYSAPMRSDGDCLVVSSRFGPPQLPGYERNHCRE